MTPIKVTLAPLSLFIIAALTCGSVAASETSAPAAARSGIGLDRIVTAEEQAMELEALRLMQDPVVLEAKQQGGEYMRRFTGSATPKAAFDAALDRSLYCGMLTSINADPKHPKIHAQAIPEHPAGSVKIPDSACGIPNPDTIYRFIPIDGDSHYIIHGQVAKHRPIENNFTLASFSMTTLGNVNGRDLQVDEAGRFTITVGPEAANGRKNHLQTRHDAWQIWVRDTLGDWSKERPNLLTVERTGPVNSPPLSRTAKVAMAGNYLSYIIRSMPMNVLQAPPNTFANPKILGGASGEGGFLVTQAYSNSRFKLKEDEALILNITMGFSGYVVVPATNLWGSNDGVGRMTGSLNNFQADKNADGTYTFVISARDPGVANWVDTAGLEEGTLYLRWAAFDNTAGSGGNPPLVSSSVVKLDEVAKTVPAMRKVSSAQRAAQASQRREQLLTRQQLAD